MTTIPASEIVAVNPSVLGVGGSALDLLGLLLTTSSRVPIATVASFPDAESVEDFFGPSSAEAAAAAIYFAGFEGASKRPAALLFAQYNAAPVAAYMRGGNVSALTIEELKAITGPLNFSVDGTAIAVANVDLSSATSFSSAATILQTAIQAGTNPDATCVYDSISGAFVITSPTTGASSTITFATGAAADGLKLTAALGAVLSQGAAAAVPAAFMNEIVNQTTNWATFATLFNPDLPDENTVKMAFAAWVATTKDRFGYVCWDPDVTPTQQLPATGSMGYLLAQNGNSGTCLVYSPTNDKAVFICGVAASLDTEERNGRTTFAFKQQAGLLADVTTALAANNLAGSPQGATRGNGYNFYGAYGAANADFIWLQRGFVTGPFAWFDSYVNQIWLNNAFQLALLNLLKNARSVPFNTSGDALIETALADPIAAGLNFGAYAPGDISQAQIAAVNAAAGRDVANSLQAQGYYLLVEPASSQVRAARGPKNVKFWYLDRGSVQSIQLDSVALQ